MAANRLLPSGRVIESATYRTAAVGNKRDRDFTASPGFHALRLAFDLKCLGTTKLQSAEAITRGVDQIGILATQRILHVQNFWSPPTGHIFLEGDPTFVSITWSTV